MELGSEEIRSRYNETAQSYDWRLKVLETVTDMKKPRRELLQKATGQVLSVAVGTGKDLEFYPRKCSITGIDLSGEMLKIAKNRAEKLGLHPVLQTMDVESLQFHDHSFDTVVSTLALCTFSHPIQALQEMKRVCKPEGKILLFEHGRSSSKIVIRIQELCANQWIKRIGCHLNREPVELVEAAGLKLISNRQSFFGILHIIEAIP